MDTMSALMSSSWCIYNNTLHIQFFPNLTPPPKGHQLLILFVSLLHSFSIYQPHPTLGLPGTLAIYDIGV